MLWIIIVVLLVLLLTNYGAQRASWYGPGPGSVVFALLVLMLFILVLEALSGAHLFHLGRGF